jgi:hypothetical protein
LAPGASKMKGKSKKLLLLSIALFFVGITCLILEYTFFQYLDENGYLHESLFLPLGAFSVISGGVGIVAALVSAVLARKKGS